ncbi:hypothetical protein ANCCAN_18829 [Ancylostoma caninum]|uniref:Peptidase A2 domain-containing protein n=1 Tax=Ancylostoma caninum TaxID=29170 RepID=A0A368FSV8_ANCCA|nr:hypothetical protein ANCCAN_18829 [Ancylostoma caninum]
MTSEGNIWNFSTGEYEKVLFFFDSGAYKSVIEESLANRFGLPRETTKICTMSGMGGHIESFKSHIVNMRISTAFSRNENSNKTRGHQQLPECKPHLGRYHLLKESNICLANSKLRGE